MMARTRSSLKAMVLAIMLLTSLYSIVHEGSQSIETIGPSQWDRFSLSNNNSEDWSRSPLVCNENYQENPSSLVKDLKDSIVSLAHLYNMSIIQLLERTLNSTTADLTSLLQKIKKFQKLQRCASCFDKRTFPTTFIGTNSSIPSCGYWNGLPLPVIGTMPLGRLGNVMGEYATMLALREIFNASAVLTKEHKNTLQEVFPHLSLPVVDIGRPSDWTELPEETPFYPYYGSLQLAAQGLLGNRIFLSSGYPFEMSLFNAYRDKIRREFRFADEIVNKAQNFLSRVAEMSSLSQPDKPISFIGVHVRMTDYMKQITDGFGAAPVDYEKFVSRAVQYYVSRLDNLIFVVASDDIRYAKKVFDGLGTKNVFYSEGPPSGIRSFFSWFTSKDRPGEDMSLLAQCNHSIITLGSYGFWTGYLSPGMVLYPDVKTSRPYSFSRQFYEEAKLDDFIPIKL